MAVGAHAPAAQPAIDGMVFDADGIPVPKAVVRAQRVDADRGLVSQAGLSGRFRLLAPPGRYRVEASWSFYVHGSRQASMVFPPVEVEAGARAFEIRARIGRTIEGRIEGPPGLDLSGVQVQAEAADGPESGRRMSDTTDALGRFSIVGLRDGPYRVSVLRSAWLVDPVPDVQAGTRDLKLVVQRGLEIAGRLDWGRGPMPEGLRDLAIDLVPR